MPTVDIPFPDTSTAYWAVAQLQPSRTVPALNLLIQEGFTVYAPRVREHRVRMGRYWQLLERAETLMSATICPGVWPHGGLAA
jgi:hypothetical protein